MIAARKNEAPTIFNNAFNKIMTDNPKALIRLPEVNLGITPGWGGIQRLPRVLGKSKALDMIIFSKRLSSAEALAIGLMDKVVPATDLMKEATAFAVALPSQGNNQKEKKEAVHKHHLFFESRGWFGYRQTLYS